MDPFLAIGVVATSYGAWVLGVRRARVIRGRREGIERAVFAAYDHRALARESAALVLPSTLGARGASLEPRDDRATTLPLGPLPEPWRSAPWGFSELDELAEARDLLVEGRAGEAAALAAGHSAAASLFAWASFSRLFAGDLDEALAAARALPVAAPAAAPLAARLIAGVLARTVEVTPSGPDRDAGIREAVAAALAAGAAAADAPPALAGLLAHLRVLGLSLVTLESTEIAVRRVLDRAVARHPDAPCLHFVRAHLAAALGQGAAAAEHLTRALYYSRGDAFYTRVVRGSAWLARYRPALYAGGATAERDRFD